MHEKQSVGWREWVHLPDLVDCPVKAKIDTGAKTSAIHAFFVEEFSRDGEPWVRFGLHPMQKTLDPEYTCEAKVVETRRVTDSGGHQEERYVIETALRIGGHTLVTEMTLTNRETMLFRMLLGRNSLAGRFVVDPQASFLCGGDTDSGPKA
ncbi:ATP-dependent zinc protease [Gilvimarinus agarilyticus]|uniref:ATP-dependent zinc protease family protein n=1 Tax=unclassified Gilvimarinus TaxID=2642066 RepID=UPI001C0A2C11|nr:MULTISPECIES: ATP-dependent zinc protease [unclassified Gilvimarinus]MBU2887599.1 ATP-dependent zinc protease [Gilvimarinus agarilyticus]MDO6572250.1 ATP-dependent zinc protease [Gilvimarinus sp. 2_MG-2023]MDO6746817.1 ATP-dependent zinc protease [Gilvimarinus sp. 1_MG-2023]